MSTSTDLPARIASLQQRQQELASLAAQELEQLRLEVERQHGEASLSLQTEVDHLRSQLAERDAALESLRLAVEGQLHNLHRQLRSLSLDSLQAIEDLLDSLDAAPVAPQARAASLPVSPSLPALTIPTPLPAVQTPAVPPAVQAAATPSLPAVAKPIVALVAPKKAARLPVKQAAPKKKASLGQIISRAAFGTISLATVAVAAFYFWGPSLPGAGDAGMVAGASTDSAIVQPSPTPATPKDAVVPYAQTEWGQFEDPVYGIALKYPKNATGLVYAAGNNNVFFLRGDGYLLKTSRLEPNGDAQAWLERMKHDYAADYAFTQGTLNKHTAWVGTPKVQGETSGTLYLLSHKGRTSAGQLVDVVYQVWAKDEPADSDDGLRLADMLSSLQFLP